MTMTEFTAQVVNAEIRRAVVETIEGIRGAVSVKARLRTAAKLLGLPVGRVRDFHYNRVRLIPAHEAFQILKLAQEAKRAKFARLQHEYEALRLEMANTAPSRLELLLPPSVAPLPDFAGGAAGGDSEDEQQ